MSVDIYVEGLRPPDERHKTMVEIYEMCNSAGVRVPEEVLQYLDENDTGRYGVSTRINEAVKDVRDGEDTVYIIDLSKLPVGVTSLRVFYG